MYLIIKMFYLPSFLLALSNSFVRRNYIKLCILSTLWKKQQIDLILFSAQPSGSPVILTPNAKRKLPVDATHGFSSKKRKSIKHNFNFELLPSNLFSSSSTPVSGNIEFIWLEYKC